MAHVILARAVSHYKRSHEQRTDIYHQVDFLPVHINDNTNGIAYNFICQNRQDFTKVE